MEDFLMNSKERERERILSTVHSGKIKLTKAAQLLNLSHFTVERANENSSCSDEFASFPRENTELGLRARMLCKT